MGLHLCALVLRGVDPRGEFVEVANNGTSTVTLSGLKLTDYTATQQHVHVYEFPRMSDGTALMLTPGQCAYVFTGHGTNALSDQGDWLLFAGKSQPVWNNTGDVAYLRLANGEFIDTMTVGKPKRHPNGH